MSLTVSRSVYIGSSSLTLGNVIAFSKAEIYKKLFDGWIDLTALQKSFPSRIEIGESMVSFIGPVAIVKSPATLKAEYVALAGIAYACAAIMFLYVAGSKRYVNRMAVIIVPLVVGGVAALAAAHSVAAIQPNIYFG